MPTELPERFDPADDWTMVQVRKVDYQNLVSALPLWRAVGIIGWIIAAFLFGRMLH